MKNYACFRCGWSTRIKTHMKTHLNRKIPCKALVRDINTEEYAQKILEGKTFDETVEEEKVCNLCNSYAVSCNSYAKYAISCNNSFSCKHCGKSYPYKYNLTRHLKTCKKKVDDDLKDELIRTQQVHHMLAERFGDNPEVFEKIRQEVKFMLYNNRGIVHSDKMIKMLNEMVIEDDDNDELSVTEV